jgi:hypothetical protein
VRAFLPVHLRCTLLVAALLVAAACSKPAKEQPAAAAEPPAKIVFTAGEERERGNLLNLSLGAGVVSRTGEATLDSSAVRAIDGAVETGWVTPPNDPVQSVVLALPSPTRVTQVGLESTEKTPLAARSIQFELSADGVIFGPPIVLKPVPKVGTQLQAIPPTEAAFLRVTNLDASAGRYVLLRSLQARGTALAPPAGGNPGGCWSINGQQAVFATNRSAIRGSFGQEHPIFIDGGFDGRVWLFTWTRGVEFGVGGMTVTPDGKHLTGLLWHEEALIEPQFFADAWYGQPCSASAAAPPLQMATDRVFRHYMDRFHYFPLLGLRFDGQGNLNAEESAATVEILAGLFARNPKLHFTVVAHELRRPTRAENAALARAKLASLVPALQQRGLDLKNVRFVPDGSDHPHRQPAFDLARALYGGVELYVSVPR